MLQVTPQMRVLVAIDPVDFRAGIDGLARVCRQALSEEPYEGALFVFRNRRGTAVKLLNFDGRGFWLCQRRLSAGKFRYWPSATGATSAMQAHELQVLLCAGDPGATRAALAAMGAAATLSRQGSELRS
jgi:transposase